jgi:two-component sensor histidine kinase
MLHKLGMFIDKVSDSHSSSLLFALSMSIAFGAVDTAFESGMSHGETRCPHTLMRASSIGVTVGATAILLLKARQQRRILVREEMRRLLELNHRLRNSLQVIADSHYFEPDESHRRMMSETVESMDETLKQLFPAFGMRHTERAA